LGHGRSSIKRVSFIFSFREDRAVEERERLGQTKPEGERDNNNKKKRDKIR